MPFCKHWQILDPILIFPVGAGFTQDRGQLRPGPEKGAAFWSSASWVVPLLLSLGDQGGQ